MLAHTSTGSELHSRNRSWLEGPRRRATPEDGLRAGCGHLLPGRTDARVELAQNLRLLPRSTAERYEHRRDWAACSRAERRQPISAPGTRQPARRRVHLLPSCIVAPRASAAPLADSHGRARHIVHVEPTVSTAPVTQQPRLPARHRSFQIRARAPLRANPFGAERELLRPRKAIEPSG